MNIILRIIIRIITALIKIKVIINTTIIEIMTNYKKQKIKVVWKDGTEVRFE